MDSHNEVRLRPLTDAFQTCRAFRLTTTPPALVSHFTEPGGEVDAFSVTEPHTELAIVAEAEVETFATDPFAGVDLLGDDWEFYRREDVRACFAEFLAPSHYTHASDASRRDYVVRK